ncbi:LPXTG cell wall anchor domain-containing protein [Levilactobacillus huananensis]|uniref:LPXTG cell wall anchor domain-containing protein n=1 Tax=Levilactobacillus huananensis TaxID=2486019 RepID=UPI000F7B8B73|nr:LPXTG cell wall anchor domain-containing protein [Levilactobacillus huananensis]
MKKFIVTLIMALALTVGIGATTPALAATVDGISGTTQTSVYIQGYPVIPTPDPEPTPNPPKIHKGSGADLPVVPDKPSGKKTPKKTSKVKPNVANTTKKSIGTIVKAGSADLIAGRLPQTNESRVFLTSLVGLLLLIALVLAMGVYRQARLLRERG